MSLSVGGHLETTNHMTIIIINIKVNNYKVN